MDPYAGLSGDKPVHNLYDQLLDGGANGSNENEIWIGRWYIWFHYRSAKISVFSVLKKIHAKQAFEINFIYFLYSSGCWKLWLCIGQSSIREKHCPPFGGWWWLPSTFNECTRPFLQQSKPISPWLAVQDCSTAQLFVCLQKQCKQT